MLLTPHFARWEFTTSQTAARLGIDNAPTPEAWENLFALSTMILEPARERLGPIRISSGYRSPLLNSAIRGAVESQHTKGEAADIIPLACSLEAGFRWIYERTPFDQLIWEFGTWIHVSYVSHREPRGSVLLAHLRNGRTHYAPMTREQIEQFDEVRHGEW